MSKIIKQTIVAITILIMILFITILGISIYQYKTYKIVDGQVYCGDLLGQCHLQFSYKDKDGNIQTNTSPISFDDIGKMGVFNVKVAYSLHSSGTINDLFVIGSPFHIFIGTKSMLIIYAVLSFLSIVICLSFIPNLYISSPPPPPKQSNPPKKEITSSSVPTKINQQAFKKMQQQSLSTQSQILKKINLNKT